MNNKDFIAKLAQNTAMSQKDTARFVVAYVQELTKNIANGDAVAFGGLGTFEVREKEERTMISPTTKEKIVIPAKKVVAFKPTIGMKDKLKTVGK